MNNFFVWVKYSALAFVSFLCVCWVLFYKNTGSTAWTEMVSFFFLTYWLLSRNKSKKQISTVAAVSAIWVGGLITPTIVKVIFWDSTPVVPIFLVAITLGIALGWFCHNRNNLRSYLIAIICGILYNSVLVEIWEICINR